MTENRDWESRLAQLRKAFDEGFASPLSQPPQDLTEFALIAAGRHRCAIRINELAGLEPSRKVVPLPAKVRGLLGLSAVQGQLVPVFDLAALLGGGARDSAPRWMAMARGKEPVGFAFDEFEGSCRVPLQAVHALETAPVEAHLSRQAILVDSALVPVLEFASLRATIGSPKTQQAEIQKGKWNETNCDIRT